MSVSIRQRLLVTGSIILTTFVGLTGIALDQAHRKSALEALKERGQVRIYSLISAADMPESPDSKVLVKMPAELPEARFSEQGSGLYGLITQPLNEITWRSPSAVGVDLPVPEKLVAGVWDDGFENAGKLALFRTSYQVEWEGDDGQYQPLIISVYEEPDAYYAGIESFRKTIWTWLVSTAVVLLLLQLAMLAWGLRPLRKIAADLDSIEKGVAEKLTGDYPQELSGLADNINSLLISEKRRLERYRNALGDLSHSLKTPLAIIRGETGKENTEPSRVLLEEQTNRMRQTIDYHLQKASAAGRSALSKPLEIQPVAAKILAALNKVYADKSLLVDINIAPDITYAIEEGDLMELLGNLLDNACKWAKERIKLTVEHADNTLRITVEDDGPGIEGNLKQQILKRGVRADSVIEGHGLGLAMVREIADLYMGVANIERSELGGMLFRVSLPTGDSIAITA